MWRGGAAHLRTGGRQGPGPDLHSHFAIQLTVGCRDEISFRGSRAAVRRLAPGWLVGSDRPHWMRCRGVAASLFLDPLSIAGRRIAARLPAAGVLALSPEECTAILGQLEGCWQRGWRLPELQIAARRIVDLLAPTILPLDPLDPRVRAVVDSLMLDSSENTSLQILAAGVGLSESRLAHLFRRQVGLPMRQYRLSLRMMQAARHISLGRSLTEAAHMAGFSDSAHFCRICRRMFGSAPSSLPVFTTEL